MVSQKKCIGSLHILGNAIKFQGQIYWMKCKICLASVDYRQDLCVKLLSLPWRGVWVEILLKEAHTSNLDGHSLGGECGLKYRRLIQPMK